MKRSRTVEPYIKKSDTVMRESISAHEKKKTKRMKNPGRGYIYPISSRPISFKIFNFLRDPNVLIFFSGAQSLHHF